MGCGCGKKANVTGHVVVYPDGSVSKTYINKADAERARQKSGGVKVQPASAKSA